MQMADQEANWGFVAEKESLIIYASILPCTVALEFDASAPDGAVLRNRHCYEDAAGRIEAYTGVPCQILSCARPGEILVTTRMQLLIRLTCIASQQADF